MMDVDDLVEQAVVEQEVIMELLQQELELLTQVVEQVDQEIILNQQCQVQQAVQVSWLRELVE